MNLNLRRLDLRKPEIPCPLRWNFCARGAWGETNCARCGLWPGIWIGDIAGSLRGRQRGQYRRRGRNNPTTPTVTVTPSANSISVAASLQVTVTLSGSSGTPSGTVILTSGSYTSSPATLSGGTATVTVAARKTSRGLEHTDGHIHA